jgi:hypothetical protein
MRQRRTPNLALVVSVILSLSACTYTSAAGSARTGGSSSATSVATAAPTAAALYQLMRRSGAAAKSVHVKGDYIDDGQHLQLDVAGDRAGTTMRLLVNFGSGGIEILKVNGDFYLKADATFWTRLSSAATAKVAAGKYVKVPAGSAAGMGGFRVGTLLAQVFAEDLSSVDKLNATVQKTNLDGVRAYLLTTKVGGDAKIYVSADGGARLLRADDAKSGTLDFTQWDGVAPTSAPPDSQLAQVLIL